MIGHLRGKLLAVAPSRLLLDVGGVGYEVQIPLSTYYEVQRKSVGEAAELFVHTHVREDAIVLFGFRTEHEKRLFELLITVSGVGPRLAQTVLSGLSPEDLVAALAAGDVRRLQGVPGIGKKTAERLIIDLRDRLGDFVTEETRAAAPPADSDLVSALLSLGYKATAAERAVSSVARENPEASFADLLRLALKQLSRV
jgi:Holliday junction DNA helicase RuvA